MCNFSTGRKIQCVNSLEGQIFCSDEQLLLNQGKKSCRFMRSYKQYIPQEGRKGIQDLNCPGTASTGSHRSSKSSGRITNLLCDVKAETQHCVIIPRPALKSQLLVEVGIRNQVGGANAKAQPTSQNGREIVNCVFTRITPDSSGSQLQTQILQRKVIQKDFWPYGEKTKFIKIER